jgi:cyclic pyranopterin phosphate synthase
MPEGIALTSMDQILTYEEIQRVVEASAALGITHYRLTGGEPLVRRDVEKLVAMIKNTKGVKSVTMTTNGARLSEHAAALGNAGLNGVNVSLDTVDAKEFLHLTGQDALPLVLSGIEAAQRQGLLVKLNAVIEAADDPQGLIQYAQRQGLLLRFIELMPIGYGKTYTRTKGEDFLAKLEKDYGESTRIHPEKEDYGFGPAVYYRFPALSMPIGLIRAVHHPFCTGCNRVRLTAEGKLKLCLCYEDGTDLRQILRSTDSREPLMAAISEALKKKPAEHCFLQEEQMTEKESMVKIGG